MVIHTHYRQLVYIHVYTCDYVWWLLLYRFQPSNYNNNSTNFRARARTHTHTHTHTLSLSLSLSLSLFHPSIDRKIGMCMMCTISSINRICKSIGFNDHRMILRVIATLWAYKCIICNWTNSYQNSTKEGAEEHFYLIKFYVVAINILVKILWVHPQNYGLSFKNFNSHLSLGIVSECWNSVKRSTMWESIKQWTYSTSMHASFTYEVES